MNRIFASGLNLIIAPGVYLAGQILLSQWPAQGPDTIWFLSHALLLVGAALFIPAIAGMVQYLGEHTRLLASLGGVLAAFGAMALAGQFTIDLAVGHITSSQAEMSAMAQKIQSGSGMNLIFYALAPVSFFIGQLVLVLLLAYARLIPRWTGFLAVIGFMGIGLAVATNHVIVFLLGFMGLALGPARVGWQILRALYSRSGNVRTPLSSPAQHG